MNLQQLHLRSNKLTGVIPECLADLQELVAINLADNQFEDALPRRIFFLKRLKRLTVQHVSYEIDCAEVLLVSRCMRPALRDVRTNCATYTFRTLASVLMLRT